MIPLQVQKKVVNLHPQNRRYLGVVGSNPSTGSKAVSALAAFSFFPYC